MTVEEWLARGVCSQGHALHGPSALVTGRDGVARCAACEREMAAERQAVYGTARR